MRFIDEVYERATAPFGLGLSPSDSLRTATHRPFCPNRCLQETTQQFTSSAEVEPASLSRKMIRAALAIERSLHALAQWTATWKLPPRTRSNLVGFLYILICHFF
jgi:hypothetical protein